MTSRMLRNCWKLNRNLSKFSISGKSDGAWSWSRSYRLHTTPTIISLNARRTYCAVGTNTEEAPKFTDENFDQLRKEIQRNGFINHKIFETLIGATPKKDITNENALLLITCCAHLLPSASFTEKINLFRKTWDQLQSETELSRDHYLAALEVFRANKFPLTDYKALLKDISFELDAEFYEGLIGLACEHGGMDQATEFLGEMNEKQFPITEAVFNALILGYSRQHDIKNSESVLSTMVAANLNPSNKTYTELMKAYIENGVAERAMQVLVEQKDKLKIIDLVSVIKAAAIHGEKELINQSVSMLPVDMVNVLEVPSKIQMICTELVYGGFVDAANLIVNAFPKPKFVDKQDIDKFGVSLINDCIKTRQPATKTINICKELMASGRNPRALHVATSTALRLDPEVGLEYLKALGGVDKLKPHYFWPLILHNAGKAGEVGIINTVKGMTDLGVEIDYDTMSSYVFPRLSVTLKDVKKAIIALEDVGLKTSQFLTPLIAHLLPQQRLSDIVWILEHYQSKVDVDILIKPLIRVATNLRASKNPSQLAQVVALLQKKSANPKIDISGEILLEILSNKNQGSVDSKMIADLVREFKLAGVKISPEAAEIMSSSLTSSSPEKAKVKATENLNEMVNKRLNLKPIEKLSTHPRDMSLEDLECHLVELESKGMNVRGVLRRLLQLAVREKKYDRAFEIYKKCLDLKVHKSPGMMASVFEMFVKVGKPDEAGNTISELKKSNPGFLLDEHKIIDFATLLVRNGRLKDAKAVLKERAASTKIQGGEYVSKNVWDMLNATAHYSASANPKSDRNETRDMLELVTGLGYCAYSNVHLGCIIRECLLKKQIIPAVGEFRRITTQFRKTPLQVELMNELVRLSATPGSEHYQSMLQDVVRQVTKIHGVLNANISVILAIAEHGSQNQLRKLLIDPQFKFNEENLMRNCEHLSSAGKIDVLIKLAKASRGLGHAIKEDELYSILLNSFARENNHKAALELFERLESDDDLKISQDFAKGLVDLLKRNNLEIPNNVALRARVMV